MKYLAFLLLPLLVACEYETSPWATDAHCPGVSIEENLQQLKALEAIEGPKDYFQVGIVADPQEHPGSLEKTLKKLNNMPSVDLVFIVGDLAHTGLKSEFEWVCKAIKSSNKPVFSVIGNHDGISFGPEIWQKTFGPLDFSFTYHGTKFVAYNDNKYEFKNVPDRDWLTQQAEVQPGEIRNHTIGLSHIAPWENDLSLSQHLKDSGFDHMIHAHVHKFDYWQLEDVQLPHYEVADSEGGNFALMSVHTSSLTLENCSPGCVPAQIRIK